MGSTTWKRKKVSRCVEADSCYYFEQEKLVNFAGAFARESNKVVDFPNPDLLVEVDLSPSNVDRPGIYSALQVPELWRLRNRIVSIEQLVAPGVYVATDRSRFLPVGPEDLTRWVFVGYAHDPNTWKHRLREWVQTELKARFGAT